MIIETSNQILSSESPSLRGDYSADRPIHEGKLPTDTSSKVVESIESYIIYSTHTFPPKITLELDLKKIERQELIYDLNKVLR